MGVDRASCGSLAGRRRTFGCRSGSERQTVGKLLYVGLADEAPGQDLRNRPLPSSVQRARPVCSAPSTLPFWLLSVRPEYLAGSEGEPITDGRGALFLDKR